MKLILIACVCALTAATFYFASQSADAGIEAEVSTRLAPLEAQSEASAAAQDENRALTDKVAALSTQITDLTAANKALSSDLDSARAALSDAQSDTRVEELSEQMATQDKTIDGLNAQTEELLTNLQNRDTQLEEANTAVSDLTETVDRLTTESASLSSQVATLTDGDDGLSKRITELEEELRLQTAELDGANAAAAELTEAASSAQDALTAELASNAEKLSQAEAMIAELSEVASAQEAEIAGAQATIAEFEQAASTHDGDLAEAQATITELTEAAAARDLEMGVLVQQLSLVSNEAPAPSDDGMAARVVELEASLESSAGELVETEARVSALRAELEQSQASLDQAEALAAKLSALASRTLKDASDVDQSNGSDADVVSITAMADTCTSRATDLLAQEQISFGTGTSAIANSSAIILERLTGIALACSSESMVIEVGGHTDSQGDEANNQVLSEARAQAVVQFMTERGVSADSIRATGFGETQPIAGNDTNDGRAANRRITFEWQPT